MASSIIFCSACGAKNLESHAFCSACGHALSRSAIGVEVPSTLTGRLLAQTLLKQRYRVLHLAGKGGMGAVYIAQDSQLGDRLVAVKEMSQSNLPPQDVPDAVEAFKREAHLLAGLQHPNLPSIHDHFEEAGRWYLVMSFIQGVTLQEYLSHAQGGKLPLEEAVQIGLALCNVLDYLHTYQPPIIFRDLKPSNIMRTSKGHIYLIDFGIARHFKPGQSRDTAYYGSAGYSPPEQYGQAQTSERSDIYSLGATLYHILSGYQPSRSPFRLPPLQTLVSSLPSRLVALITQMLELEESKRPESIKAVQQELQQSVLPEPVAPPPPPLPRQEMPVVPPPPPKQIHQPPLPRQETPVAPLPPNPVTPAVTPPPRQIHLPPPPRKETPAVAPPPPRQDAYPYLRTPAQVSQPVSWVRWLFFVIGLLLAIPLVGLGLIILFYCYSPSFSYTSLGEVIFDFIVVQLFLGLGPIIFVATRIRKPKIINGKTISTGRRILAELGQVIGLNAIAYPIEIVIWSVQHGLTGIVTNHLMELLICAIVGILLVSLTRIRKR